MKSAVITAGWKQYDSFGGMKVGGDEQNSSGHFHSSIQLLLAALLTAADSGSEMHADAAAQLRRQNRSEGLVEGHINRCHVLQALCIASVQIC